MAVHQFQPAIHEFSFGDTSREVSELFLRLASRPYPLFLDGCGDRIKTGQLNRYSYLCADPIESLILSPGQEFDFSMIRKLLSKYRGRRIDGLPPFQGGLAGLLSYELNGKLERISPARIDDFGSPLAALFVYDTVIAMDHALQKAWIISQGWPESNEHKRASRARQRLDELLNLLTESKISFPAETIATNRSVPQSAMHRLEHRLELYSDLSRTQFFDMINRAVDYIRDGDVFQVNLSQRLLTPATCPSPQLYLDMRKVNPAPFSGYLDFGTGQVISASPERLVSLSDRQIETRPIKGTRKRTRYPEVDLNIRQQLLASQKDRAENVMIVDLMRNDLSRVAEPDSVLVQKLCGVEQFQNVLHLVSVVHARLQDQYDGIDLLRAVFPGGSITGAPKIRAMEIISELEPTARGPYCGSLGYFGFDSVMDFNILIRTITAKNGWWQIPVGGGIVSESEPELEYEETWTKAIGMLNAVTKVPKGSPRRDLAGTSV